jgi:hypothetical protein
MKNCQNLEDFMIAVGGREEFESKCEKFDEMNQLLIHLYHHHLNSFKNYLSDDEKDLIDSLEPLTDILYWRKT